MILEYANLFQLQKKVKKKKEAVVITYDIPTPDGDKKGASSRIQMLLKMKLFIV